jgi:hypothetical protein
MYNGNVPRVRATILNSQIEVYLYSVKEIGFNQKWTQLYRYKYLYEPP